MKKAIVGVIVGAVAYFIWEAVSWMAIPWHNAVVKSLPEETLIMDTLRVVVKEPGFYFFPHKMDLPSATESDGKKAWEQRYRAGPVGALVYSPAGREPMDPTVFLKQFVTGVFIAALVMFAFYAARDRFVSVVHRAHLAAVLGLLAGLASHVQHRIWFAFPMGYTIVNVFDLVIAFAIMGAAMAKFVPEA